MTLHEGAVYTADYIYHAPAEDTDRCEVIDGRLYVSTAPDWLHQRALMRLSFHIAGHVYERNLGELAQNVGVILAPDTGVVPDLVYVSRARLDIIDTRGIKGVPDLVVEALSPGSRSYDLVVKRNRYARAGVPHYWVLDPEARTLTAYRLGPEGYVEQGVYGPTDTFEPELFPGLAIPLNTLWK